MINLAVIDFFVMETLRGGGLQGPLVHRTEDYGKMFRLSTIEDQILRPLDRKKNL
jgi:hypothetical protein